MFCRARLAWPPKTVSRPLPDRFVHAMVESSRRDSSCSHTVSHARESEIGDEGDEGDEDDLILSWFDRRFRMRFIELPPVPVNSDELGRAGPRWRFGRAAEIRGIIWYQLALVTVPLCGLDSRRKARS